MPRAVHHRPGFEILSDLSSGDDDSSTNGNSTQAQSLSAVLTDLSIPDTQNRRSSTGSNASVESITADLKELRLDTKPHQLNQVKGNPNWTDRQKRQPGRRLRRSSIAPNTFDVLETVPEDESRSSQDSAAPTVSDFNPHYLELPAEQYSKHPLAIAARNVPSPEEQLAKHRDGQFEWVLSVNVPADSPEARNLPGASCTTIEKLHFGCNLLPIEEQTGKDNSAGDAAKYYKSSPYILLVTPLLNNEELRHFLGENENSEGGGIMAFAQTSEAPVTPTEEPVTVTTRELQNVTPESVASTAEDGSFAEMVTSRSPAKPVSRIEDSLEALDQLEDQLEAFDEAAGHLEHIVSPEKKKTPLGRTPVKPHSVKSAAPVRFATPQPERSNAKKTPSASLRVKPCTEPRRLSLRKSASMIFLDSPKLKTEDKPLAQAPPKDKAAPKAVASLLPPKPPAKSTKQLTVPTFELPGEAVARKLKEKREARLSMVASPKQAPQPAASIPRRTKSAKPPTRPSFELPGEAISRRKREEREAKLKVQEEEEKKRREFKAKPIRSGVPFSTFPRETVTSRARQNKLALTENSTQQPAPSPNKRLSASSFANSRPPLINADNQAQARGRGLQAALSAADADRAVSTSTRSISGKRSSVSVEDVQQQKLRGQQILKRDNSLRGDRQREKQERENLAKLAREEAAERSRQLSREWAAKQVKKRMNVGSIRDVVA